MYLWIGSQILLSLLLVSVSTARIEGEEEAGAKILTVEDFATNRVPRCSPDGGPTTLTVQIGPTLPPYEFRLIPESTNAQDGAIHYVGRIEISKTGAGADLQTIRVMSNWNDSVCRLFDMKDVNFDGYLDISVVREGSATWASRDYYVFDPQSGRFIANDLTRDLGELKDNSLDADWKTREIRVSFIFSLCGGTEAYRIANDRLMKVQSDEVTVDTDRHKCIQTIKRRAGGKWKVVRVESTELAPAS